MSGQVLSLPFGGFGGSGLDEVFIGTPDPGGAYELWYDVVPQAAALTRVKSATAGSGNAVTSQTCIFAAGVTVGNGIVAAVLITQYSNDGAPSVALVDSSTNPYTLAKKQISVDGNQIIAIFYCPKTIASGASLTLTASGFTGNATVQAIEVSGVGNGLSVIGSVGFSVATPSNPGSMTTGPMAALSAPAGLLMAVMKANATINSVVVESVAPAWTQEAEQTNPSFSAGEVDSRVVALAAGATPSCTWTTTLAGSAQWCVTAVAFSGGVTYPPGTLKARVGGAWQTVP